MTAGAIGSLEILNSGVSARLITLHHAMTITGSNADMRSKPVSAHASKCADTYAITMQAHKPILRAYFRCMTFDTPLAKNQRVARGGAGKCQ